MARKRTIVAAAVTGVAVAVAVAGAVNHVAYAATTGSAYVWAGSPSSPSYTPAAGYSFNSTGGVNTITHDTTGAGQYTVNLPGLGGFSGTVLVTAYGGANSCTVVRWGPSPSNSTIQQVHVQCFTVGGAPVDSAYTVSFTNRLGSKHAWLWANQASAALNTPYQPAAGYQANSTGLPNTVTHRGTGVYRVSIPVSNVGTSFGHWEVTAYGAGTQRCLINVIGANGVTTTAELADVVCVTPTGAVVDSMFTVTWVLDGNVLGQPVWQGSGDGYPSLYVQSGGDASRTSASDSSPGIMFAGGGGNITLTHQGTGTYIVHTPLDPDLSHGDVQVTTGGNPDGTTCVVQFWNPTDGIHVNCYGPDGKLRDEGMFVSFIGAYLIA